MAARNSVQQASVKQVRTFCRVCEPCCGLIATVQDGTITSVTGDKDHVLSRGHFCKKAMGAVEITYDPDRVTQPLKRVGKPGEFIPISWEQAMSEIAERLTQIRKEHGPESFTTFLGQPPTNAYGTALWFGAFKQVMNVKWNYGVNAEDSAAFLKANQLIFGTMMTPIPDFWRTKFAIIIGANPFVSHGSIVGEPQMRDCIGSIVKRGGRVVVIDPRRTETALSFEHIPVNASSDAFLLAAMLNEIFAQGLEDREAIETYTSGVETLIELVRDITPEVAAQKCGLEAQQIRDLARDFATAESALIYGRTGTCTQRFGTLINLFQTLLIIVTGNLDRPGGNIFGWTPFTASMFGAKPRTLRSRTTNLPEIANQFPSRAMISDILEPGPERIRALMMLGGNPVNSSAAAGEPMEKALEDLELHFALDLYVTETTKYAHYILPVATMFEHEDIPFKFINFVLRPSIWVSRAIVKPRGEVREEWRIFNDLCRRMGLGGCYVNPWFRRLAKFGINIKPSMLADHMLRMGPVGDRYGLRPGGLSMRKLLRKFPAGKKLLEELPTGAFSAKLRDSGDRIHLVPQELVSELASLLAYREVETDSYPLRMIGMREVLSQNTWMHNAPSLMPESRTHHLHMSTEDASQLGIKNGEQIEVSSSAGRLRTTAKVSDRMKKGNVALPHGWGHNGGWTHANGSGGVNSNVLASNRLADTEAIAGMSILNGIPVRVERAEQL